MPKPFSHCENTENKMMLTKGYTIYHKRIISRYYRYRDIIVIAILSESRCYRHRDIIVIANNNFYHSNVAFSV